MRFMVQVRASDGSEAGEMPSAEMLTAMGAFNEKLIASGKMLGGDGLHPTSKGARITWRNGKQTVTDGPFPNVDELVSGYWMIQAASKEEVIELFKDCPPTGMNGNGEIEIRQVFDPEDFADVAPPELIAREKELREQGF